MEPPQDWLLPRADLFLRPLECCHQQLVLLGRLHSRSVLASSLDPRQCLGIVIVACVIKEMCSNGDQSSLRQGS